MDTTIKQIRHSIYDINYHEETDKTTTIENADETQSKMIKRLVYHLSNEKDDEGLQEYISCIVIFLNLILSPVAGILITIRAQYDQTLSISGVFIKIIYMFIFAFAIYFDKRYENKIERISRLIPKILSMLLLSIQLYSLLYTYNCHIYKDIRTCL